MYEFKVGDSVKLKNNQSCNSAEVDVIYQVQKCPKGAKNQPLGVGFDRNNLCHCQPSWELITSNNNQTNSMEKFKAMMKKEPMKSFYKAGLTDSNDVLTTEGKDVFLNFLLAKNQDAFKTEVADLMLAEDNNK